MTTPYPPGLYVRIGGSVYQAGDNGREIVHGSAIKGNTVQQRRAIADLIAVAPELVDACIMALDALTYISGYEDSAVVCLLDAVLSKAGVQ